MVSKFMCHVKKNENWSQWHPLSSKSDVNCEANCSDEYDEFGLLIFFWNKNYMYCSGYSDF